MYISIPPTESERCDRKYAKLKISVELNKYAFSFTSELQVVHDNGPRSKYRKNESYSTITKA